MFSELKYGRKGLLLLAIATPSQAAELSSPQWYWHAFASQGAVYTSDNQFFGDSDDGVSADFREAGLILGAQPWPNLQLVGQLLSRKTGDTDDGDVQLDYAFASYSFAPTLDWTHGVKAGRIRSPFGFYNETRDVAHTRSSILLPQSIYIDRMRNLSFARDGVQLFGSYQQDLNTLSWDLSYSQILVREEDYPEILGFVDLPGQIKVPFSTIARLIWDWDMGRARVGLTYSRPEVLYRAADVDYFRDGSLDFHTWLVSAEYNEADWSLISEASYFDNELKDFLPSHTYDTSGYGYYVQGVYRFLTNWDLFARWDVQYANKDNKDDFRLFAKDFAVGVGWRPDSHWLVRGEWHHVDGTAWLSFRENPPQDLQRRWQMILFQISYRI